MKYRIFSYISLCFGLSTTLWGQNVLSKSTNIIQPNSLLFKNICYFDPGLSGEDVIWDFRNYLHSEGFYPIIFNLDSADTYTSIENQQLVGYYLESDTLFNYEIESPLKHEVFPAPILKMKYPFCYGDSITKPFIGYGFYCGDHPYIEKGISTVMADAYGSIILSNKDSLKNVLRVYSLKSSSICMDNTNINPNPDKMRQIIEERYDWYARGCRYPVFTSITYSSYDNLVPVGLIQKAFCYLPEDQLQLNDSVNKNIIKSDSLQNKKGNISNEDIIHYSIDLDGNAIIFKYNIDKKARIVAMVSNFMGIIYNRKEWDQQPGNNYSMKIDCSGLHRGQYILYINVNGKIYNNKINL